MINKFLKITLVLIISLKLFSISFADEFVFEVTELKITDNGNIYKGINKGKIITETKVEITSNNFEYLKKINQLEAYGDAQILDIKNDIIINAEQIFYLKDKEIIYTVGKTFVKISNKYTVEGYDLKLLRNEMILSSLKKVVIKDSQDSIYKLNQFQYSINEEILKGKKIEVTTNNLKLDQDQYFFESGLFNFKDKKFLGKDTNLIFHKSLFDDVQNDPRLKSVYSHGDEFNTYFEKGVFTSCKKKGKCPPWKITSRRIKHDKIKKQINYTDAWLSIYSVPVLYFPKFFHPDPTVKRQSGFLKPSFIGSKALGNSSYIPYFFVISEDKDMTIKPRYFRENKFILQNEYRHKTKDSMTIADFSIAKGIDSSPDDMSDNRSHFFVNSKINLDLEKFLGSDLEINLQKTSNDSYLRAYDLESPLLLESTSVLTTGIELDLEHKDFDFIGSFLMYETLNGLNSDRFQYVLPTYSFSKNFELEILEGTFNFEQAGNNTLDSTNIFSSTVSNDLNYSTFDKYTNSGIKTNFSSLFKNLNSVGNKHSSYKSSPRSEIMSTYIFNASLPLSKNTKKNLNRFEPKMSFRFSPHDMKDSKTKSGGISTNNVYGNNRLGLSDTYEGGESLTIGLDYKKEKLTIKAATHHLDEIQEVDDYLDIKLATVLRLKEEDGIPISSTLNKKTSNILGQIKYKPSDIFSLDYNFSLNNDMHTLDSNSVDVAFNYNNFSTTYNFLEERGVIGSSNIISNESKYRFNPENSLSFKTRRNRDLSLTEYYNLVYEYKNDCLVANIEYKKKYYESGSLIPLEELFFSVTIVPLTTFSPDKMILNKTRMD